MELNKTYPINIISQLKDCCSFLVVEEFNDNASQYFLNYYHKLQHFNQPLCDEWFRDLDRPDLNLCEVILAQTNLKTKSWSRGIISRYTTSQTELYFIDTQRIFDLANYSELRVCPPKLFNLALPTYNICINIGLNDDWLQSAIELMIAKNQYGEISFSFIPQSVTSGNIYIGEILVRIPMHNNATITLEKYLKKYRNIKKLEETTTLKYSPFDPLKFKHLQNIFVPKNCTTRSFSEMENSPESNNSSTVLTYSNYYSNSDTSASATNITENIDSSFISTTDTNSVLMSSLEKTHNTAFTKSLTKSINQKTEKNQKTFLDFYNNSTTIEDLVNLNGTCSDDTVNSINVLELKLNSDNNQEMKADISNDDIGVKISLSNDHCLMKSKDEDFTVSSLTTVKESKKPSGTLVSYPDAELWWSDSDDE